MWDWMRQGGSRGDRIRRLEEWSTTAFAESPDGIHREKPELGLFEVDGSRDNIIVWMGPGATWVLFAMAFQAYRRRAPQGRCA